MTHPPRPIFALLYFRERAQTSRASPAGGNTWEISKKKTKKKKKLKETGEDGEEILQDGDIRTKGVFPHTTRRAGPKMRCSILYI